MGKIKKILEKELGSTQSVEVYPVTSIEAVYDENNERLDNIINRKNNETQKELKAEVARATNAESNLRETINNITEINENATSANIVTIDTIPNTSSSNVQQALNELFKNATLVSKIGMNTSDNPSNADLDVADEDGNVILRLQNGHIKTKNFDSGNMTINNHSFIYYSNSTGNSLQDNVTLEELYSIYDGLVTKYPQYIRRAKNIGETSGGLEIRQYEVCFTNPKIIRGEGSYYSKPNLWDDAKYAQHKILINAGVHGDEKAPCIATALAIKDIVEGDDIIMTNIKSNLIIKVIPTLNPYGFNIRNRTNENDVNLNRDFGKWTQNETIAWKSWIDENSDALLYIDTHGVDFYHPFIECVDEKIAGEAHIKKYANIAATIASLMYYNWKDYLQDVDKIHTSEAKTPRPYMLISDYSNMSIDYTESIGIEGFIFETPTDIVNNGYNPAPNYFKNYSRSNKLTKDFLINLLNLYADNVKLK